jgi:hypothetical protein
VERAVNREISIIPFRIEDVLPSEALEYFISTTQWIDAFTPPLEKHVGYLVQNLKELAPVEAKDVKVPEFKPPVAPQAKRNWFLTGPGLVTLAAVAVLSVGGLIGGFYGTGIFPRLKKDQPPDVETTVTVQPPTERRVLEEKTSPGKDVTPKSPEITEKQSAPEVKAEAKPESSTSSQVSLDSGKRELPQVAKSSDEPQPPGPIPKSLIQSGQKSSSNWPWTSRRLVTRADLVPLSPEELELMRNEIFARHGWVFKRYDLQAYFEKQPWYRPKGTLANREAANRLAEREITPLERRNIKAIQEYENTR